MNPETLKKLKSLHCKRGSLKSQMSLFEKALLKIDTTVTLSHEELQIVEVRLNKFQPVFDNFNDIQSELELLTIDNSELYETELQAREEFQDTYFTLNARANTLLNSVKPQISENSLSIPASHIVNRTNIKLPSINLPNFDGNYTQWRSFHDAFNSLIHVNTDLSPVEKLTYLKSSLKGEPYTLISSLDTTDLNYSVAWDVLLKRYDNKRRIINSHVQNILNIPISNRETSNSLREIANTLQTNLNCLRSLGQLVENWDALLVPIVVSKLDNQTVKEWEVKLNNDAEDMNTVPSLKDLLSFIMHKQNILEILSQKKGNQSNEFAKTHTNKITKAFTTTNISCSNCQKNHFISNCDLFLALDNSARSARARELKICINCLRKGHFLPNCKSLSTCRKCKRRHNTLLHFETKHTNTQRDSNSISKEQSSGETSEVLSVANCTALEDNQILLSTAIIQIKDSQNKPHSVRVLLDSASQSSFITESLLRKLNQRGTPINQAVGGIGGASLNIKRKINIHFNSIVNNFEASVQCLVIPKITSCLPTRSFNTNNFHIPPNIKLADPTFNTSSPIDMLIGAKLFWSLICIGQFRQHSLMYQKTKLGWIISGELLNERHIHDQQITCVSLNDLNVNLERFWQCDEFISNNHELTLDEQLCEEHFIKTTERNDAGRFVVKFPFKPNVDSIGNSYSVAKSRLESLERRFRKDSNLKPKYCEFMREYIELNHMTKVTNESDSTKSFFLPHHCVIKEQSETTKLRVVFDGSCKLDDGLSINAVQYVGATLQDDIFSILARFRLHQYVLTADIAKMYRQVLIHPDHRKFQKILWRENSNEDISIYELNTVTYGTTSAPFLAIRCLLEIASESRNTFPLESKIIREDFYVDDLITGSNDLELLKLIKINVQNILSSAGFQLHKFNSNVFELRNVNSENNSIHISNEDKRTLGIIWNSNTDNFTYSNKNLIQYPEITKRTILSLTAQLYDPLGILAPIIILAKLIIQELWQLNLTWDESVPMNTHLKWLNFKEKLKFLNKISIQRHVLISNHTRLELHAFADASERAYGACVYARSVNEFNQIAVHLISAKSRVAPLKSITLPRLELCAAVLAAQLVNKFKSILRISIDKEIYWSDSTITLCWIKGNPKRWKTYVSNRVSEIQRLTDPNDWFHVTSGDNPADLISRGMLPDRLIHTDLWWSGPHWLSSTNVTFSNFNNINMESIPETRNTSTALIASNIDNIISINNFSSLTKLIRIGAYCLRFIENCKKAISERITCALSPAELNRALNKLVKFSQLECFPEDYKQLLRNGTVSSKSKILSLTPFLDGDGLIRVGGRIQESNFSYGKKHPILISNKHHLTKLIFESEHKTLLHAGPTLLLNSIRNKFWPISGRNMAKGVVRSCIKCFRFNPKLNNPIMGNLPSERITPMPPFTTVGIDYAGPISIKDKQGRGAKSTKCYISIFICFSTKAIHLEPVTSLSTEAFIATFRRFASRRGSPTKIFSDNGTNFVGANTELINLFKFLNQNSDTIVEKISRQGVDWHFIPSNSPHFGGLWEAGVKSTKFHLKRVMQNASLTFEDLYTLLVQIESVLNSRPLTPLSSDPNDLEALTPAHFLIGRPLTTLPDPDVRDINVNRCSRYQHLQRLNQHFWDRWSRDYITQLQQRVKWKQSTALLEVGALVLIKEDHQPPANWRLGRVTEVFPGKDNVIRVASVRCGNAVFKRPLAKLCVLPISEG